MILSRFFGPTKICRTKLVKTCYWCGDHASYRVFRDEEDRRVDLGKLINNMASESGAVDGDEIILSVRKSGRRPFGDRRVRLVRPHTYERERQE